MEKYTMDLYRWQQREGIIRIAASPQSKDAHLVANLKNSTFQKKFHESQKYTPFHTDYKGIKFDKESR